MRKTLRNTNCFKNELSDVSQAIFTPTDQGSVPEILTRGRTCIMLPSAFAIDRSHWAFLPSWVHKPHLSSRVGYLSCCLFQRPVGTSWTCQRTVLTSWACFSFSFSMCVSDYMLRVSLPCKNVVKIEGGLQVLARVLSFHYVKGFTAEPERNVETAEK